jgi:hypothetical protein
MRGLDTISCAAWSPQQGTRRTLARRPPPRCEPLQHTTNILGPPVTCSASSGCRGDAAPAADVARAGQQLQLRGSAAVTPAATAEGGVGEARTARPGTPFVQPSPLFQMQLNLGTAAAGAGAAIHGSGGPAPYTARQAQDLLRTLAQLRLGRTPAAPPGAAPGTAAPWDAVPVA